MTEESHLLSVGWPRSRDGVGEEKEESRDCPAAGTALASIDGSVTKETRGRSRMGYDQEENKGFGISFRNLTVPNPDFLLNTDLTMTVDTGFLEEFQQTFTWGCRRRDVTDRYKLHG